MDGYRSVRGLATAVTVLLGITLLVDVVSIGSGLLQLELIERIQSADFTQAELTQNDAREVALGFAATSLYVVTGIVFIVWFRRAYQNLDHFGHVRALGTGWAIGGWIVPIVSLYRPFQMAREIWHASDPESLGGGDSTSTPGLLASWWGAWIVGNVAGQIALRTSLSAESVGEIQATTVAQLVANAVTIVSAPLAILVVRELTRRQEARATGLGDVQNVARIFD